MKAVQFSEYGDTAVLKLVEQTTPAPGADQVLVAVHAVSLNPFDSKLRDGMMKDAMPLTLPITIGGDIAGVVSAVGDRVKGFLVGERVFGQANAVAGNSGALAEYAATSADQIAHAPAELGFTEAAALPLVGVSALQAITDHLNVAAGQKIFIHGGGGGIGAIAIQIAKHLGAYVATTATGQDVDFVTQLGADEAIDYKTANYVEALSDYDAAFDTVGDNFTQMLTILKHGGRAVSMTASAEAATVSELGVTALTQGTRVTRAKLDTLRGLVEAGVVTARIGQVFSLDHFSAAFQARESGAIGKIIITVAE